MALGEVYTYCSSAQILIKYCGTWCLTSRMQSTSFYRGNNKFSGTIFTYSNFSGNLQLNIGRLTHLHFLQNTTSTVKLSFQNFSIFFSICLLTMTCLKDNQISNKIKWRCLFKCLYFVEAHFKASILCLFF